MSRAGLPFLFDFAVQSKLVVLSVVLSCSECLEDFLLVMTNKVLEDV